MKIIVEADVLDKTLELLSSVVNDKLMKEDFKSAIIFKRNGALKIGAVSLNIKAVTDFDCEVQGELAEGEVLLFKIKDVKDILSTFKGLSRTKVRDVEFDFNDKLIFRVNEVAIDETADNADIYNKTTEFKLAMPRKMETFIKSIEGVEMPEGELAMYNSLDLLLYINTLLPTISNATREAISTMYFDDDNVYTLNARYVANMPNKLNPKFCGFKMTNASVAFLKSLLADTETIEVTSAEVKRGVIRLYFRKENTVAVIDCGALVTKIPPEKLTGKSANAIVIDKGYLTDVLKRMAINPDGCVIDVNIVKGEDGKSKGTLTMTSKTMKQDVPVMIAKGEGRYSFKAKADLLSSMVINDANFAPNVFMYFDKTGQNTISFSCSDNTALWETTIKNLLMANEIISWQ